MQLSRVLGVGLGCGVCKCGAGMCRMWFRQVLGSRLARRLFAR